MNSNNLYLIFGILLLSLCILEVNSNNVNPNENVGTSNNITPSMRGKDGKKEKPSDSMKFVELAADKLSLGKDGETDKYIKIAEESLKQIEGELTKAQLALKYMNDEGVKLIKSKEEMNKILNAILNAKDFAEAKKYVSSAQEKVLALTKGMALVNNTKVQVRAAEANARKHILQIPEAKDQSEEIKKKLEKAKVDATKSLNTIVEYMKEINRLDKILLENNKEVEETLTKIQEVAKQKEKKEKTPPPKENEKDKTLLPKDKKNVVPPKEDTKSGTTSDGSGAKKEDASGKESKTSEEKPKDPPKDPPKDTPKDNVPKKPLINYVDKDKYDYANQLLDTDKCTDDDKKKANCKKFSNCYKDHGKPICICFPGYSSDDASKNDCTKVDSPTCKNKANTCHRNANCTFDKTLGIGCQCKENFKGDGLLCSSSFSYFINFFFVVTIVSLQLFM